MALVTETGHHSQGVSHRRHQHPGQTLTVGVNGTADCMGNLEGRLPLSFGLSTFQRANKGEGKAGQAEGISSVGF